MLILSPCSLRLQSVLSVPWHFHCYWVCWGHSELWATSVAPVSVCPSFLFPCSLRYTHLQMFQLEDFSDVFVYWERNPLLNYSCPTCNFKGRDLEVPLCHHAVDVIPVFLYISSLLLNTSKRLSLKGVILIIVGKMYKNSSKYPQIVTKQVSFRLMKK